MATFSWGAVSTVVVVSNVPSSPLFQSPDTSDNMRYIDDGSSNPGKNTALPQLFSGEELDAVYPAGRRPVEIELCIVFICVILSNTGDFLG